MGLAVKGSKIQQTMIPDGALEDNVSTTNTTVHVGKDWTMDGEAQVELKGAEGIEFRDDLLEQAPEKVEQYLADYFAFGHADAEVSQVAQSPDTSRDFLPTVCLESALAG